MQHQRDKEMNKDSKVFIADDTGMVRASFVCYLKNEGYTNAITSSGLELTEQSKVIYPPLLMYQPRSL